VVGRILVFAAQAKWESLQFRAHINAPSPLLFAALNLEQSIMRTLVAFLLGLIIGGVAMLFLPDPRRDELNAEIRTQTEALQTQLRQFGDQLKGMKLPQPENSSPTPSPSATR
jgi:hypothetical protein